MHDAIRLIVQAKDSENALSMAKSYADDLVESKDFDWYDLDGRWGKSVPYKLTSKQGQALVKEGMEATRQKFDDAMRHVRYMLEHFTDDQIYNEQFGKEEDAKMPEEVYSLSRWQFTRAGDRDACYVYGEDMIWGGAIEHDRDLEIATKGHDDLWVVLVDFHN